MNLRLALTLLPLGGCLSGAIGPQIASDGDFGLSGEIRASVDSGHVRTGPVLRGRGGPGWADGGLGLDVCTRTYGWTSASFCGRVMAVELGRDDGAFALGILSPSVSIGLWKPLLPKPDEPGQRFKPSSTRLTSAFIMELNLGLDVRPLHQWQSTTPYVGLSFGAATGASWY